MAKYAIAIVGAGPSGYFAAQALQNLETEDLKFSIDLIERLPTPWGLVRSGVAPDHPKIKSVSKVFENVANQPNFRLFGNVELGRDFKLDDLQAKYDAVVLCTGSSIGKKLGIPGENLINSILRMMITTFKLQNNYNFLNSYNKCLKLIKSILQFKIILSEIPSMIVHGKISEN